LNETSGTTGGVVAGGCAVEGSAAGLGSFGEMQKRTVLRELRHLRMFSEKKAITLINPITAMRRVESGMNPPNVLISPVGYCGEADRKNT
jgi:hypothetical protein